MPDESLRVPAWCPQCRLLMKSPKSSSCYYSWGVCQLCFIQFIEGREERWKSGWRPSPEEVERFAESMRET